MDEAAFERVLGLLTAPGHSAEDAKALLCAVPSCAALRFSSTQTAQLYSECSKAYESTADSGLCALRALFHNVTDPWALHSVLRSTVPAHTLCELRQQLGWSFHFDHANPTAHYTITLHTPEQRAVLRRLCAAQRTHGLRALQASCRAGRRRQGRHMAHGAGGSTAQRRGFGI
eukprot:TRINITY_DN14665_c0_g1_i1.p2 TRINITY_DN14665_c0_g1~~TRINITY_DN14665_c0_g1_i1.p2  ORF type:complete len:173 (+),score=63.28 TRINITY_DN14665_c0_g1_i1:105-623(+)